MRKDADGNDVFDPDEKKGGRFQGKPRDNHQFDRQSGRGRGTRNPDEKKGGAGRGNWGAKPDRSYKQGRNEGEGVPDGAPPKKIDKAGDDNKPPAKVEEEKVPEVETEEVILGVGLDDFLKTVTTKDRAQGRKAEGIKGAKVEASTGGKSEKVT